MSYTREKTLKDGTIRHYAVYLGADGRYHEEGGYKTETAAAKIAAQRELEAARGDWASPMAGRTTFSGGRTAPSSCTQKEAAERPGRFTGPERNRVGRLQPAPADSNTTA
jgi:hypothetical protein